jgi:hypothetical protein
LRVNLQATKRGLQVTLLLRYRMHPITDNCLAVILRAANTLLRHLREEPNRGMASIKNSVECFSSTH